MSCRHTANLITPRLLKMPKRVNSNHKGKPKFLQLPQVKTWQQPYQECQRPSPLPPSSSKFQTKKEQLAAAVRPDCSRSSANRRILKRSTKVRSITPQPCEGLMPVMQQMTTIEILSFKGTMGRFGETKIQTRRSVLSATCFRMGLHCGS